MQLTLPCEKWLCWYDIDDRDDFITEQKKIIKEDDDNHHSGGLCWLW